MGGDEHGLFVVDEDFVSYVPGMHIVVFTRYSSVARALASTPICCSIRTAIHYKDQAKRRHVSHRSMGACGAFFSLRVLVSKSMHTSR